MLFRSGGAHKSWLDLSTGINPNSYPLPDIGGVVWSQLPQERDLDALIEVAIKPHRHFRREGNNILLEVPISLPEALGGAKITVPTIDGPVSLKIPAGANSGTRLRLKGKGIPGNKPGDMYVVLEVTLPPSNEDSRALYENMKAKMEFNPRAHMGV